MSDAIAIADAVVESLNAESFDLDFKAERLYRPFFKLPEMASLKVSVVPRSIESEPASRETDFYDYAIDVAIQMRPGSEDSSDAKKIKTEMDGLMDLVEAIDDHLRANVLPDSLAKWVKSANDPIFSPEHLAEFNQFTSVLTVTYQGMRSR